MSPREICSYPKYKTALPVGNEGLLGFFRRSDVLLEERHHGWITMILFLRPLMGLKAFLISFLYRCEYHLNCPCFGTYLYFPSFLAQNTQTLPQRSVFERSFKHLQPACFRKLQVLFTVMSLAHLLFFLIDHPISMAYISSEPIKTELYFPVDILRSALLAFSHCGNVLPVQLTEHL